MADAGVAYIRTVLDPKGAEAGFAALSRKASTQGAGIGGNLASGFKKMAGPALAAGVVVGLTKLGESFEGAYKTIRVSTGATGKTLEGLKGDFKAVLAVRPDNMKDVGNTIAGLNQRLGLTGKPLRELSTQMLQLSGITKTDVSTNLTAVSKLFNNMGVAAKDQSPKLDELFKAGQKSGLSVSEIADSMTKLAGPAKAAGLDFDHMTGLIASLGKAGIKTTALVPALGKVIQAAGKHGVTAGTELKNTFALIQKAPDPANVAIKAFGARIGPQLAAQIKSGRLSVEDMTKSIKDSKGAIATTAKDTATFSGKWKIFVNQLKVKLEPTATKFMDKMKEAMIKAAPYLTKIADLVGKLSEHANILVPAILAVSAAMAALKIGQGIQKAVTGFRDLGSAIAGTASKLKSYAEGIAKAASNAAKWVVENVKMLAGLAQQAAAWAWNTTKTLAQAVADKVTAAAQWLLNAAMDANPITLIIIAIVALIAIFVLLYTKVGWFRDAIDKMWQFVQKAWDAILGAFKKVFEWVKSNWPLLLPILLGPIGLVAALIIKNWDKIKEGFDAAVRGIKRGIEAVVDFFTKLPGRIVRGLGDVVGAIGRVFAGIANWIKVHVIDPVVDYFVKWPGRFVKGMGNIVAAIGNVIRPVVSWIKDRVIDPVVDYFVKWPGRFVKGMGNIVNTIGRVFSGLKDWIGRNTLNPIVEMFRLLPGRLVKALGGIASAVAGSFKGAFNGLANAWNSTIGKVKIKIPDILGLPGRGKEFGIPNLPVLKAEGGLISKATQVIVGEAGPELILPLADPKRARALLAQYGQGLISPVDASGRATASSAAPDVSGLQAWSAAAVKVFALLPPQIAKVTAPLVPWALGVARTIDSIRLAAIVTVARLQTVLANFVVWATGLLARFVAMVAVQMNAMANAMGTSARAGVAAASAAFSTAQTSWPAILGRAARTAVATMVRELTKGVDEITSVVRRYAKALADGLNPVLTGVGDKPIVLANGGVVGFANGTEHHIAQIARPGQVRVWAEPETEGEAYIPLAGSKRGRSKAIAEAVVRKFGGAVDWFAEGGVTAARRYADAQVGQPYVWGGVGPNGFDCSGFASAILNVFQGLPANVRRFTSNTIGPNAQALGLKPGMGLLSFGTKVDPGGHVASTIAGWNAESTPPAVRTGPGARGAMDRYFQAQYSAGKAYFLAGGPGAIKLPGVPTTRSGVAGDTARKAMAFAGAAGQRYIDANVFDIITATGGDVGGAGVLPTGPFALPRILATIRAMESGNNYGARNPVSTASGAYQFLTSTWQGLGGSGAAWQASPSEQDRIATAYVNSIVGRYGEVLEAVPASWYTGSYRGHGQLNYNPGGPGNPLTVQGYVDRWIGKYNSLADGAFIHAGNFDAGGVLRPGWNKVRNDTGRDEPLAPTGQGPAVVVQHAEFHEPADVDLLLRQATFLVQAGRL